ncbi:MAG: S8 family serine peptidase, partial [Bifidobacteriaceae bacterium]|nr:S8 family serine peptidase [Bifidobacteriaceae bacterium]
MLGNRIAAALALSLSLGALANLPVAQAAPTEGAVQTVGAKPTKISLKASQSAVSVGRTVRVKVKSVRPAKASKAVTWSSSNKNVAVVTAAGKVSGKKPGVARITAVSKADGKVKAWVKITVSVDPTRIALNTKARSVQVGKNFKASVKSIRPAKAKKYVAWSSSNKAVAKVSSAGLVTGVKSGSATITAKSILNPRVKARIKVRVQDPVVPDPPSGQQPGEQPPPAAELVDPGPPGGGDEPVTPPIQTPAPPVAEFQTQVDDQLMLYATGSDDVAMDAASGVKFVANQVIVSLEANSPAGTLESLARALGGAVGGSNDYSRHYQVVLPQKMDYTELQALATDVGRRPGVSGAFVNYPMDLEESDYYPPDAEWSGQWDAVPSGGNWGMEAISAPGIWDHRSQLSRVNVGVLDVGFSDHEDLDYAYLWANDEKIEAEDRAHGTHVSGTIAATMNTKGVAGVAPNARLHGAAFRGIEAKQERLRANGVATVSDYEAGLTVLIVMKDCRVVNLSMGETLTAGAHLGEKAATVFLRETNRLIEEALLIYLDEYGNDFVIAKSAGNANNSPYYWNPYEWEYLPGGSGPVRRIDADLDILSGIQDPKLRDRILVVGAATNLGGGNYQVADFSNGGGRVDLIAPGYQIQSTTPGDEYGTKSGTSMAAPHVAGVAATVWGANPKLTGAEVKKIIVDTASDQRYGYENSTAYPNTYRMLNGAQAVEQALTTVPPKVTGFEDPNLAKCVQESLDQGQRIAEIAHLNCSSREIASLTGIELATGLQQLVLDDNRISSLIGASFPAGLQFLGLGRNGISS